jgi:magnesium chelatase family protein
MSAQLRYDLLHKLGLKAVQQLHLSARAYHRVLKLARTIADLACSEQIQTAHSARQSRPRQRRP